MPRLRCERSFDASITDVFAALVRMLALRRWDPGIAAFGELSLPRAGCRYARQTPTALREGRVVEIIRPVSVTLVETLHDPPCRVALRHRWRVHPVEPSTLLRLSEIPTIVGVKEASGNLSQMCAVCRDAPEGFSVLSGDDAFTLAVIAMGVKGWQFLLAVPPWLWLAFSASSLWVMDAPEVWIILPALLAAPAVMLAAKGVRRSGT